MQTTLCHSPAGIDTNIVDSCLPLCWVAQLYNAQCMLRITDRYGDGRCQSLVAREAVSCHFIIYEESEPARRTVLNFLIGDVYGIME